MKWRFGAEFLCTKVGDHCSLENLPDSGFNSLSKCLSNLRNKYLMILYNICQPCVSFPSHMTLSSGGTWIEAGIILQTRMPTFICVSRVELGVQAATKVLGWGICSKPPPSTTPLHCPCSQTRTGSSSSFTFQILREFPYSL